MDLFGVSAGDSSAAHHDQTTVGVTSRRRNTEEQLDEWRQRLERYYSHYKPNASLRKIEVVASRIVENPAVWLALLGKYGPELDAPYDQPLRATVAPGGAAHNHHQAHHEHKRGARAFLSAEEARRFWVRRFVRYYAFYDPTRPAKEVESFVNRIPLSSIESVWAAAVAKRGPEPIGDPSKRVASGAESDALRTELREVAEFEGVPIEVVRQRRVDEAVARQYRMDRIEREKAKLRIATLREQTAASVSGLVTAEVPSSAWDVVNDLVECTALERLQDLWVGEVSKCAALEAAAAAQRGEEKGQQNKKSKSTRKPPSTAPTQSSRPLTTAELDKRLDRRFWHGIISAYDTKLSNDPFAREELIDSYAASAGGLRELLATLEAKEEDGLFDPVPLQLRTAREQHLLKQKQQQDEHTGVYRLFHDMSPKQFWTLRIRNYYAEKGIAKSPIDVEHVVDLFLTTNCETMWTALCAKHGEEAAEETSKLEEHREFWASRCRAFVAQHAPHVTALDIDKLLDNCARNWRSVLEALERRYREDGVESSSSSFGLNAGGGNAAIASRTPSADVGGSKYSTALDRRRREEERAQWERRMLRFLAHHNPEKATYAHVGSVLDRAERLDGGWAMAWGLLLTKYGPEPPEVTPGRGADGTPATSVSGSAAHASLNEPPTGEGPKPRRHIPSVHEAEALLKNNRDFWRRRIREYLAEKRLERTDIEIEIALDKYADGRHPDGFCALWEDLQSEFGHSRIAAVAPVDGDFWQFALRWYRAQKMIDATVALSGSAAQVEGDPRTEFMRLYRLFGPVRRASPLVAAATTASSEKSELQNLLSELRSEFHRERERRCEPGAIAPTVEFVVPRAYWVAKLEQYRREHCPSLSPSVVDSLLETGEVSGVPMEKLFLQFVQLCASTNDVAMHRRNPLHLHNRRPLSSEL